MAISAAQVKELRERTNGGMMECKKALVEAEGDIDKAAEILRKKGLTKAAKKAGRVAAEGIIVIKVADKFAVMVEVNSETDFVAKEQSFKTFAEDVADVALKDKISDPSALANTTHQSGETFETVRHNLVAKLGENIQVRRIALVSSDTLIATYQHGSRIGVLVNLNKDDMELGKDLAMHIAASSPTAIEPGDIPQTEIDKEREIFSAQAQESGKPPEIIEKMVEGRIKKFVNEQSLVGQPFVKDPNQSVGDLLSGAGAKVIAFQRFELGEGIEKKQEDFAEEVMAQVRGTE